VRDAAVVEHLDIRLPRAASLSGRIVDEAGDPVQGVRVEALEMRSVRGRRLPVQAAYALTNDIGEFRMGGLNPGAYYLRASSTETWTSDDGRESFAYAQTFYPGAATLEDTQPLSIALGQQASGLDFALMPRPAQRITGMLVNAAGEPIAAQRIHLDRIERTAGGALLSAGFGGSAISREDGTFAIAALPPGEYMIYSGDREKDFTQVQVFVADERVGVALTPRRIARVSGAVFAEDGKAPDFPAARIRVLPIALDETLPVWGTPGPQAVRADWTFEIANLDGPFLFRITGLPEPWMLRAVRLGGADVTDAPVQLPPAAGDLKGLQLVLSRTAGGRVSGLVTDAAGAARADSTVVVFGVDSATWTPGSRFVRGVRPADDGRFAASGLPAGRYYAIARDFLAEGEWEDPAFLREAARTAAEFALDPGGSIDLALELPQP
jgi:hypothetical protein